MPRSLRLGLAAVAAWCLGHPAAAQAPRIVQPTADAVVANPVTIVVQVPAQDADAAAMPGMAAMEAMSPMMAGHHGAHVHIIIDAPVPAQGRPIPMDARHLHLIAGETRRSVVLRPGRHRIVLVVGGAGHQAGGAALVSDPVDFTVR